MTGSEHLLQGIDALQELYPSMAIDANGRQFACIFEQASDALSMFEAGYGEKIRGQMTVKASAFASASRDAFSVNDKIVIDGRRMKVQSRNNMDALAWTFELVQDW